MKPEADASITVLSNTLGLFVFLEPFNCMFHRLWPCLRVISETGLTIKSEKFFRLLCLTRLIFVGGSDRGGGP